MLTHGVQVLKAGSAYIEDYGRLSTSTTEIGAIWHCSLLEGAFSQELSQPLGGVVEPHFGQSSLLHCVRPHNASMDAGWMSASELTDKREALRIQKATLASQGLFLQSAKIINEIELVDTYLHKLETELQPKQSKCNNTSNVIAEKEILNEQEDPKSAADDLLSKLTGMF